MRKTLLIPLAIIGGAMAIENAGPTREKDCMTFSKFSNISDGWRTYTFEKDGGELYGLIGDPYILTRDSLKKEERYRPTVTDPLIGDDRLISATPCE